MSLSIGKTLAWTELKLARFFFQPNLREMFNQDPNRGQDFQVANEHMVLDYSRQLVTRGIMKKLFKLARKSGLEGKIKAMFEGEKINVTENSGDTKGRAVLHTALRNLLGIEDPEKAPVYLDGKNVMVEVKKVLNQVRQFSQEVLSGERKGATGKPIKNIVAIGIGGSYLGPEYLAEACKPYGKEGMNLVFVANVDGTDFARKTAGLDPEETMFVIISKTFTTAETIMNAETAKNWMLESLKDKAEAAEIIKKHFVAVSTAKKLVEKFGIDSENMFEFWDWVGGRFSATSAVGALPLSLFMGYENFQKVLAGAYFMDQHFLNTPLEKNIPVIAALLDIWNIDFMKFPYRAILPYSQAYMKYAPYCQQGEMESNGKGVDLNNDWVNIETGEIVYGEPGTNGQHSFYQLLHQGKIVPADFYAFIKAQYPEFQKHHDELMTNVFAQADALAFGKNEFEVIRDFIEDYKKKHDGQEPTVEIINEFKATLMNHKIFKGNRPSNVFLMMDQDPFAAGMMLALLEHRVAVKGFIWNINSFDQWGVELGKILGKDMGRRMKLWKANQADPAVYQGLNSSTALLLKYYLEEKLPTAS